MNAYLMRSLTIVCEVCQTMLLPLSKCFTQALPSVLMIITCHSACRFFTKSTFDNAILQVLDTFGDVTLLIEYILLTMCANRGLCLGMAASTATLHPAPKG